MTAASICAMAQERRQMAARLGFCDANLWLGQPKGFPLAAELSPAQLAAALERQG